MTNVLLLNDEDDDEKIVRLVCHRNFFCTPCAIQLLCDLESGESNFLPQYASLHGCLFLLGDFDYYWLQNSGSLFFANKNFLVHPFIIKYIESISIRI